MTVDKSFTKAIYVFYSLIAIFVLIAAFFFLPIPDTLRRILFPVMGVIGVFFTILGGILIYMAVKLKVEKKLKVYFILTGAAAAAFLVSIVLHNLVYALFILLFGEGFWGAEGDEPFFFLVAFIACPVVFLVGVIGGITTLLKRKK